MRFPFPLYVEHLLIYPDCGAYRSQYKATVSFGSNVTAVLASWVNTTYCSAGVAHPLPIRGWVDTVLARAVDAVMAIPTLIFALVLLSVLGTSIPVLIGTIACLASTRAFRLSRAIAGNIVALDYFEVARLRGERMPWLMFYEVLPNCLAPLTAEFGLRLCANFLFIAALSFLGLGIQPPLADWGGMVRDNASAISYGGLAPLVPAAAIGVFAIAINLVVDWILSVQAGEED